MRRAVPRPFTCRTPSPVDLIVLAKEPIRGRVKTRLCPPCTSHGAAQIAEAALADTLDAACASGADRVVLALDGRPGPWCPPGVQIVGQGDGGLDRRLTRAWSATPGPALQIGMDTPQVSAEDLAGGMARLLDDGVDAVLGPAVDGGWWAIGLRRSHPLAFTGVPMSQPDTGQQQAARLRVLGFDVRVLPVRRDVDTWDDALAVAASSAASGTRFAAAVHAQLGRLQPLGPAK